MAKLTVTADQFDKLHAAGIIPDQAWGAAFGQVKSMTLTFAWDMTCDDLNQAFANGGLLDMDVIAINNEKNTFLWEGSEDDMGCNSFYLSLGADGKIQADCGGAPLMEWSTL